MSWMSWTKGIANAAVAFAVCNFLHGDTIGTLLAGVIALAGYILSLTRERR